MEGLSPTGEKANYPHSKRQDPCCTFAILVVLCSPRPGHAHPTLTKTTKLSEKRLQYEYLARIARVRVTASGMTDET